jgi:hypothetical protein
MTTPLATSTTLVMMDTDTLGTSALSAPAVELARRATAPGCAKAATLTLLKSSAAASLCEPAAALAEGASEGARGTGAPDAER